MIIKVLGASAAVVLGMVVLRKINEYSWGNCKSKRCIKNKTFIITGASSGLSKATALELAKRGARVILACSDQEKAHQVLVDLRSKSYSGVLKIMQLDLTSFQSIKNFADEFLKSEERLDVLINNETIFQCPFMTTEEGFEMIFGVNHIGHFLLTKLLLEKLKQSAPSRIVIVTSELYKRGDIDFDNINSEMQYNNNMAYKNSKLANVLFCRELSKRLFNTGVSVYAVSPGIVWNNLERHKYISWFKMAMVAPVAWIFIRTAHQGAQTILHCAISEEVEGQSGLYYRNCEEEPVEGMALDDNLSKKLWEVSECFCSKAKDIF